MGIMHSTADRQESAKPGLLFIAFNRVYDENAVKELMIDGPYYRNNDVYNGENPPGKH